LDLAIELFVVESQNVHCLNVVGAQDRDVIRKDLRVPDLRLPILWRSYWRKQLLGLLILLQQWLNDVIARVFLILKLTAIAWHDKILGVVRRLYNVRPRVILRWLLF